MREKNMFRHGAIPLSSPPRGRRLTLGHSCYHLAFKVIVCALITCGHVWVGPVVVGHECSRCGARLAVASGRAAVQGVPATGVPVGI